MKTKAWREIRARKFSPRKLKELDRAVEDELLEMDLRELREAAGKTQEELAEALKKAQSQISRLESRSDYRLSTLQRYVPLSVASWKSLQASAIVASACARRRRVRPRALNWKRAKRVPKTRPFAQLRDLERAFAEFELEKGHPYAGAKSGLEWGKVRCSRHLDYAKSLNDFAPLLPDGKFPPQHEFVIFCALRVYGRASVELWRALREHYQRGKARGTRPATDEALDVWYAVDAWLQSWLYSPLWCSRPKTNDPSEWLRCIGSTNPTPHLRMSHAFLRRLGFPLPVNYVNARRELLDIKGVFQRYVLVPPGSGVPNLRSLLHRFPLMGWDIWQRAVYLLTNDVKPPSHFPIFGWRHQRVVDYAREGRLLHSPEIELAALGEPWSLHGLLWPQQLETLRKTAGPVHADGPPVTSRARKNE